MLSLCLALGLLTGITGALGFPADDPGIEVIDRALFRESFEGEEYILYITMFNGGDGGAIEIRELRDGRWESVCTWHPKDFYDGPIVFDTLSVISLQHRESSLLVGWTDRLEMEYREGLASLYLDYDLQFRECEEFWSD
jgi:hypothetical protein